MRVRSGLVVVSAATIVAVGVGVPSASGMNRPAWHSDSVTQRYRCSTPVGGIGEDGTVSGSVREASGSLQLSKVTYTFLNNFGTGVTINKIRFSVPDPNQDSAPYEDGSATVSGKPTGWSAGHTKDGIFEYFKGTQDVADGAAIPVPQLSASYTDAGPKGTLVEWKPGAFSFNVKSPDAGLISCTPKKPVQTFASFQE